jgi:hypothetical protein
MTWVVIWAISILFGSTSPLFAHSGGLDSCGGHHDRKHGGYHVHNQALYCGCHPESAGCAVPKPVAATPPPQKAQGVAAIPSGETVYVTATGTKYHRAGCRYLTDSSRPTTLTEAAKSKTPCSVCKPPSVSDTQGLTGPAKPTTTEQPATTQCAATTQKGARCKRNASPGSQYCWQHAR